VYVCVLYFYVGLKMLCKMALPPPVAKQLTKFVKLTAQSLSLSRRSRTRARRPHARSSTARALVDRNHGAL